MPHDKESDGDRPKKSWREIDQAREKGTAQRASPGAERRQNSQAYRSYKTQLNKLFDGGALPDALQGKLGNPQAAADTKVRKEAAAKLLTATTVKAAHTALAAYVAAYGFPRDEDVLAKILDFTDEALVLQAIQTLIELSNAAPLKRGATLKARLKAAQLTIDHPDIHSAAAALLAKL